MRVTSFIAVAGLAGVALAAALPLPATSQGKPETLRIRDHPGIGNMLARIAAACGLMIG
jgi:predicted alpha/beta-hydrolase family hydrolase